MDAIRRFHRPALRRPAALLAFEGWNDASDAASLVVTYLIDQRDDVEPFAIIEPEQFYDFQEHRPEVSLDQGGTRSLRWPTTRFYAIERPDEPRDLILGIGDEPSLRWKTYSREVTRLLTESDVEEVVLLGAFIGQIPHTQPVPVIGSATDPARVAALGLRASNYEGPTGIVGVMVEACREAGLPALSLWAATPHYLAANPNPKAALALLTRCGEAMHMRFDAAELSRICEEYEAKVREAVDRAGDFAEYVVALEQAARDDEIEVSPSSSEALLSEIEAFLKEQG